VVVAVEAVLRLTLHILVVLAAPEVVVQAMMAHQQEVLTVFLEQ
jgi:hypothetical protein